MEKMGESQIVEFFSSYLHDEHVNIYGGNQPLAIGNFAGCQDKKFADFFAGTRSTNILIEFKEFKSEYKREKEKSLRKKFCEELDREVAGISRQCHFIGWGEGGDQNEITVGLNQYIDLVCPLWGVVTHLAPPSNFTHFDFVEGFLRENIGLNYDQFVSYIDHLNKVAGDEGDGADVPFKAILYSRTSRRIVGTSFQNLRELKELREISFKNISMSSPPRDNSPSL